MTVETGEATARGSPCSGVPAPAVCLFPKLLSLVHFLFPGVEPMDQ